MWNWSFIYNFVCLRLTTEASIIVSHTVLARFCECVCVCVWVCVCVCMCSALSWSTTLPNRKWTHQVNWLTGNVFIFVDGGVYLINPKWWSQSYPVHSVVTHALNNEILLCFMTDFRWKRQLLYYITTELYFNSEVSRNCRISQRTRWNAGLMDRVSVYSMYSKLNSSSTHNTTHYNGERERGMIRRYRL